MILLTASHEDTIEWMIIIIQKLLSLLNLQKLELRGTSNWNGCAISRNRCIMLKSIDGLISLGSKHGWKIVFRWWWNMHNSPQLLLAPCDYSVVTDESVQSLLLSLCRWTRRRRERPSDTSTTPSHCAVPSSSCDTTANWWQTPALPLLVRASIYCAVRVYSALTLRPVPGCSRETTCM